MKKTATLSALVVIASFPGIASAGDLLDSPGPGYRQQLKGLSVPNEKVIYSPLRVEVTAFSSSSSLSPTPNFSQQFRLFPSSQSSTLPSDSTPAAPKEPE